MEIARLVLEYIRVLTSVQMVVGWIVLAFFVCFRKDVGLLLGRVATIKFPGGELGAVARALSSTSDKPDRENF